MTDSVENDIYSPGEEYTLFQRMMYGGIGFGAIVIPVNFFKIIFTIIFPPIGEIINIIEKEIFTQFPYITWNTLKLLFDAKNLNRIIYSLILTSMMYVPGLVYTLAKLTSSHTSTTGAYQCDPDTGVCTDI